MKDLNDLRQQMRNRHVRALNNMPELDMPELDMVAVAKTADDLAQVVAKPLRRFTVRMIVGWLTLAIAGVVGGLASTALTVWVIVLVLQWMGVL